MKKIIAVPLIVIVLAVLYFSGLNKTVETIILKNTPGYCGYSISTKLEYKNETFKLFFVPDMKGNGLCPDSRKECYGLTKLENGELKIYIDPCQKNMYYVKRVCEHEFCHVMMYKAGYPFDKRQEVICEKLEENIFMFDECEKVMEELKNEIKWIETELS